MAAELRAGPLAAGIHEFWVKVSTSFCTVASQTAVVEVSSLSEPDLNLDGRVDILDALLLAQFLTGQLVELPGGLCVADLNLDGLVDAADLVALLAWSE